MKSDLFLKKKLLVITGKGGVGKSTIAASLGLLAASQGRKTLIAEINTQGQMAGFFNKPPLKYSPSLLAPNLYGINIFPKKSFEEYVLLQIRFRKLYSLVFENRFVSYFIEATPGLAELMSIGKIYALIKDYDLVILDAPATGHGFSLLQVPSVVAGAVRVGPLKSESEKIESLLKDAEKTTLIAVSLPEEMPVNETCEMAQKTKSQLGLSIEAVIINQVFPEPMPPREIALFQRSKKQLESDPDLRPLATCMEAYLNRYFLQQDHIQTLVTTFGEKRCLKIPYQFNDQLKKGDVERISALLHSQLEAMD
ncbi:MAG: hypothetical protein A3I75_06115 [Deltaproteobacteria bacterium RIFCSPLOWO2_02_FULL_50_16]|nr:MAG: hypothetical protein A2053_00360 [Deltaproteobacteria bacterium GWA2_50_8]OGQ29998.1 MAG: hypothetical protein A3B79_06230 [Deltaproteobacteria bacterium RIFCSPHIGHO2_02_FULL_50_15]OGQ55969.1 MAG: hypothetical protein A3I75_06115 [Deltaproteobacteria bacterium RIFCSPLOWO2_02_FULL_50_16]